MILLNIHQEFAARLQAIEGQVMAREVGVENQRAAFVALEMQQVAALADLRARVARSDAAINSLAGENGDREKRERRTAADGEAKWNRLERRMQKIDDHVSI